MLSLLLMICSKLAVDDLLLLLGEPFRRNEHSVFLLHDLRHTFGSLLIQRGASLAYVKDQMGHSSIQVTVDTYGHLIPGSNRQAVDRLDSAIIPTPLAAAAV